MKIVCKKCGKRFDQEVYMGLCPNCGTYNRQDNTASGEYMQEAQTIGQNKETDIRTVPDGWHKEVRHVWKEKPPEAWTKAGGEQKHLAAGKNPWKGHGRVKKKRSIVSRIVTGILLFVIVVFAATLLGMSYVNNRIGHKKLLVTGGDDIRTLRQIQIGESFNYTTEDGDYRITITGAERATEKKLYCPEDFENIRIRYHIDPPAAVEANSWQDNQSYYDIHMMPYLLTKNQEYLEPCYAYDVTEEMGWTEEQEEKRGVSDGFLYQDGELYFLAHKGDVSGLLINSYDFDEESFQETTLRETLVLEELEVGK